MSRESEEDERRIYCPYKLQIVGQCAFLLGQQIVEKNLEIRVVKGIREARWVRLKSWMLRDLRWVNNIIKKEIPLMSYSGALASSCLESVASL